MKKFAHAVVEIWAKRTGLEQILLLVSVFLLCSIVVLLVMLRRDSAPMATEWGPVASWAGVVVTFLGFVGAIAALKVQRAAVDVTVEQHNTAKEAKAIAEGVEAEKAALEAQRIKEQAVSAVHLKVFMSRPIKPSEAIYDDQRELLVGCTLRILRGGRYKHVKLTLPEVPKGFRVVEAPPANLGDLTVGISGVDAKWHLRGENWPYGPESQAKKWLSDRIFVTFTDSSGINWKLYGNGEFAEISENVGASSPN
ncbi:hypothetical protein [Arthrobacter psychrochitiniphilus]|uniref:hypothetical protein n=1 Tax=Arthrobacter psychrochitiniphilus TaxID=291045 RepID=UPI0014756DF7|nr:hypothetical protein [Arthrobacter psychrochitiniphilus]NYG18933.1 hypothetical protein [Arthrobacter psychrochitiniphilus]